MGYLPLKWVRLLREEKTENKEEEGDIILRYSNMKRETEMRPYSKQERAIVMRRKQVKYPKSLIQNV